MSPASAYIYLSIYEREKKERWIDFKGLAHAILEVGSPNSAG